MYQDFFSLKMKPFSISPDPNFLFLSERHKEAIIHMQHGLRGYGGFALLTGEVGTGKTTICRYLIENMGNNTDIAVILNPALNDVELLTTICDNFNIEYQKDNLTSLFSELSAWMIDNHLKKRHAIVLIDEAQHLSFEALEQLRLLSNIESDNKKPLQIILIGQTELQKKLKQDEFRKVALCITARYHLLSLTQQESNYYVQHRLNIAGSMHAIFDKSALQEIFKQCHGTPRLTNILCDRSLLAAYTQNSHIVTLKMVKQVSKEILFSHDNTQTLSLSSHWRLITLVILSIVTLLQTPKIVNYIDVDSLFSFNKSTPAINKKVFNEPVLNDQLVHNNEQLNTQWFDAYPQLNLTKSKYENAFSNLYSIWGYQVTSQQVDCQQGKAVLLNCYTKEINLNQLKKLNYPGVVRLQKDSETALYAVIYKIADNYQLLIDSHLITVTEEWFKTYWSGDITLLWKAPFPLEGVIKFGQEGHEVSWLANQLNKQQGWPSENKTRFDRRLLEQVSVFQRDQGLTEDGIVGPRTLMHLTMPNSPRLLQDRK